MLEVEKIIINNSNTLIELKTDWLYVVIFMQ